MYFENRGLVIRALAAVTLGLLAIALSNSVATLLVASVVVGVFSVGRHQILVPFASHLIPETSRGKVVGTVMSGLLGGIMLARPFSSYIAATLGWRAVFYISAGMMLALRLTLHRALPRRYPNSALAYAQILRSLPGASCGRRLTIPSLFNATSATAVSSASMVTTNSPRQASAILAAA